MRGMRFFSPLFLIMFIVLLLGAAVQEKSKAKLTYAKDVGPMIKQYCLPCHLAENENPSDLALDNYETLMKGGKHGETVVAGKPDKSNLYLKLLPNPPFGKQMARNKKKLTEEEMKIVYDWIAQGAK
ncbi:MAG: hypothetical protein HY088_09745, partial [Ignavibacteriales bacterium]|nr:hypothetical protein [Ignavibacteriales bacterium]